MRQFEKEIEELNNCTFSPNKDKKLKKLTSKNIEENIEGHNQEGYLNSPQYKKYVEKKASARKSLIETQALIDLKPGSGNTWKRGITIPKQFKITRHGSMGNVEDFINYKDGAKSNIDVSFKI